MWHTRWNDWTGKWEQHYDPIHCSHVCVNSGKNCDLTGKTVSTKKGNVFYDVRISYIRDDDTIFSGQEVVRINKGVKLLKSPTSITICEQIVKRCQEDIKKKERDKYGMKIALSGRKVEIMNIRAEQRESRDLMQDLQDISEGIEVVHVSDKEKLIKEQKKDSNGKRRQKNAFKNLKRNWWISAMRICRSTSLDRTHADKWFGPDRLEKRACGAAEAEAERRAGATGAIEPIRYDKGGMKMNSREAEERLQYMLKRCDADGYCKYYTKEKAAMAGVRRCAG